jgi:hypothetical protein
MSETMCGSTGAHSRSSVPAALEGAKPRRRIVRGKPYLLPLGARVIKGTRGEEALGEGIIIQVADLREKAVLAVPVDPSVVDRFVPISSVGSLYGFVHKQKRDGILVPHYTHTHAAEERLTPYADYVQAVTFAKVIGEMEHPVTGEHVPCAVLNVRMASETYGGQLWWVIGGHNISHGAGGARGAGAHMPAVSSLGGTLTREGQEEALVIRGEPATEIPFDPRERLEGRRLRVLGYGRSSDRIGIVHESAIVAIRLSAGERLVVRDPRESLGFVRVPLMAWMRFMRREADISEQHLIRVSIIRGLEDELTRVPICERSERQTAVDRRLTWFFGETDDKSERSGFHMTPERNTPPIDRLSLSAVQGLAENWGLLNPESRRPSSTRPSRRTCWRGRSGGS